MPQPLGGASKIPSQGTAPHPGPFSCSYITWNLTFPLLAEQATSSLPCEGVGVDWIWWCRARAQHIVDTSSCG